MPDPARKSETIKLVTRMQLAVAGARSMLRRYPRDIMGTLIWREHDAESRPCEHLRQEWKALPDHNGISGIAWLGHATVLVRMGGRTILTDPVLVPRVGVRVAGRTLGPLRITPHVLARDLPPIDLIVISHAHYDHLDRPSLRSLVSDRTQVITPKYTRSLIPRGFAHVHELEWGASAGVDGLTIDAIKPRHWGARFGWDRHRRFHSYMISCGQTRLFYAGDTAYTDRFAGLGPVDLSIFGIGAYQPWEHAHATPEQALAMAQHLQSRVMLPVHYDTFVLSNEPRSEPLERLMAQAERTGANVLPLAVGDVAVVPRAG
jgi:L-ascorbate metabolism protein UlaG (beta-lactamase superfamily)